MLIKVFAISKSNNNNNNNNNNNDNNHSKNRKNNFYTNREVHTLQKVKVNKDLTLLNNALHLLSNAELSVRNQRYRPFRLRFFRSRFMADLMSQLLRTLLSSRNLFAYMLLFVILCVSFWLLRSPLSELLYFLPFITHNKLLQCEHSKLGFWK